MTNTSGLCASKDFPTLEERALLRRELEHKRQKLVARRKPGQPIHFVKAEDNKNKADQVAQLMEQNAAISLAAHTERELGKICEALRRMEFGKYGICGECRGAIGIARLRANPAAILCQLC
jgi:DnaK suppressor protein